MAQNQVRCSSLLCGLRFPETYSSLFNDVPLEWGGFFFGMWSKVNLSYQRTKVNGFFYFYFSLCWRNRFSWAALVRSLWPALWSSNWINANYINCSRKSEHCEPQFPLRFPHLFRGFNIFLFILPLAHNTIDRFRASWQPRWTIASDNRHPKYRISRTR